MFTLVRVKGSFIEASTGHTVNVSEFAISPKVTVKMWYMFGMNRTVSGQWWSSQTIPWNANHDDPITSVSWYDCQEFISRLNKSRPGKSAFRLPTQAEVELASAKNVFKDIPTANVVFLDSGHTYEAPTLGYIGDWCQDYSYDGYYRYCYSCWNGKSWSYQNSLNFTGGIPGLESFELIEYNAVKTGLKIPRYNPKGPQPGEEIRCIVGIAGKKVGYKRYKATRYKEVTINVPSLDAIEWKRVVMVKSNNRLFCNSVLPSKTDADYIEERASIGFRLCRTCN